MIPAAALAASLAGVALAPRARAQQRDSATVGVRALASAPADSAAVAASRRPDSTARTRPPIRPRTALVRSLLLPGWGQANLDRGLAGGLFAVVEAGSVAMLYQSKAMLREAHRAQRDSIYDPASGTFHKNPIAARTHSRRQQVEDWTALLIANHLFAAADAFVAAHLWDVPAQVGIREGDRELVVAIRAPW